jgi:trimethylamine--corrinoid protein Co-methyltransferase
MAIARLKFLSKDEEDRVHDLSLKVLRTIGVKVHSPLVLKMLKDAGAEVDQRTEIVKFDESIIKDALKKVPKSFTIASRDGEHDIKLPATSWPYASLGGLASWIEDYGTKKRREATRKDLATITRLADGLEAVDAVWPLVTVRDVPPHANFVHELWTCFQNTCKPIYGSAGSGTIGIPDAKVQIELGALAAGGKEQLKKRPTFTVLSCIIAPLYFEKGAVEAQCEYARAGVPVISMSMSIGGATSPVTAAGTIVNSNAENLASLVITQTASPGAPQIYSAEATLMDPRFGGIGYKGTEAPMMFAALGQMAARYSMPKMTGVLGMELRRAGSPVHFGVASAILMSTLNGTDLCSGLGDLDSDNGCSLEELVVDATIWNDFRQYMREFEISEKEAALDVMKAVGHGNTFVSHPHTLANFRKQIYNRDKLAELMFSEGSPDKVLQAAHDVVVKTLKEHEVPALDADVVKRGNEIVKAYEKNPPK